MARKCFYSFHYANDSWRVSTVRSIGAIEGQPLIAGNKWEEVERGGDASIQRWIDEQMVGRSCLIVLIGAETAGRRWVEYEIKKAWDSGKGVLGVHIHRLLDKNGYQTYKGNDPFTGFTVNTSPLSNWAKTYDPPQADSKQVYAHIANNIDAWVENAIRLRASV